MKDIQAALNAWAGIIALALAALLVGQALALHRAVACLLRAGAAAAQGAFPAFFVIDCAAIVAHNFIVHVSLLPVRVDKLSVFSIIPFSSDSGKIVVDFFKKMS